MPHVKMIARIVDVVDHFFGKLPSSKGFERI
jgi:hypothetical protein